MIAILVATVLPAVPAIAVQITENTIPLLADVILYLTTMIKGQLLLLVAFILTAVALVPSTSIKTQLASMLVPKIILSTQKIKVVANAVLAIGRSLITAPTL